MCFEMPRVQRNAALCPQDSRHFQPWWLEDQLKYTLSSVQLAASAKRPEEAVESGCRCSELQGRAESSSEQHNRQIVSSFAACSTHGVALRCRLARHPHGCETSSQHVGRKLNWPGVKNYFLPLFWFMAGSICKTILSYLGCWSELSLL